jgi:enoyl-CoA hydratase/carnithine racemase
VLASDIVIATERAQFSVGEGKVGVFDPYVTELLPLVVGLTRARYMAVSGAMVGAETAERWGIVTLLAQSLAGAEEKLSEVISQIKRTSPTARALYKRGMTRQVPDTDPIDVWSTSMGVNGREGLTAFVEKRVPVWSPITCEPLG